MELKAITWNVNGTRKFLSNIAVCAFLVSFGVIFLQETFERLNEESPLNLPGYISRAIPADYDGIGRPIGGIKTFLSTKIFGNGVIEKKDALVPNLLVVRWTSDDPDLSKGVLFLNVYIPRHSAGEY